MKKTEKHNNTSANGPQFLMDISLYYHKKAKKTRPNIYLIIGATILFILTFVVIVNNNKDIDNDKKMLFLATFTIVIAILIPVIQQIIYKNDTNNLKKTEYLLLYIANILTDQTKMSNEDKNLYWDILNKIENIENIETFKDDDFFHKNKKKLSEYLNKKHSENQNQE